MTPDKPLQRMFIAVPSHYDLINRVITWGFDERWRRLAARECLAMQPKRALDLCCGTGDLAVHLARLAEGQVELVGVDYSQPMLEIAARKAARQAGDRQMSFVYGDAAHLPFPDDYFDCVGISFAFRNLTYKNPLMQGHLSEVLRVLHTGGRYVIVETSQPKSKPVRQLFHLYLRWFARRMGYWLSGNKGAYQYLAESASRFYTAEEIREMLLDAGFSRVSFRPLFWGAVGIHTAVK